MALLSLLSASLVAIAVYGTGRVVEGNVHTTQENRAWLSHSTKPETLPDPWFLRMALYCLLHHNTCPGLCSTLMGLHQSLRAANPGQCILWGPRKGNVLSEFSRWLFRMTLGYSNQRVAGRYMDSLSKARCLVRFRCERNLRL